MRQKKEASPNKELCREKITAIKNTMDILSGKWKIHIISMLMRNGKMRFMDLLREVEGIGAKMLSKELQDMEMNHLVTRTVKNTKPITVEYDITEYGQTLEDIVQAIANWGYVYRKSLHESKAD